MTSVDFKCGASMSARARYLLDTNLPQNEQLYRDLTTRGYTGATAHAHHAGNAAGHRRVACCAAWVRAFPFHMNEGHAAFLTLELIARSLRPARPFAEAEG